MNQSSNKFKLKRKKQVLNQVSIQVSSQVPSQFFLWHIDSWQALPSLQSTRVHVDITYVATRCVHVTGL